MHDSSLMRELQVHSELSILGNKFKDATNVQIKFKNEYSTDWEYQAYLIWTD